MISAAAQGFSGIVIFHTENYENGEKADITCYISPPDCRMDIQSTAEQGSTTYSLFFSDNSGEAIMMASGNRYTIPAANLMPNKYLENILVVLPSANTKQLAGYTCKEVMMKSTNASIQCFVAEGVNVNFPALLNTRGIMAALREHSLQGLPLEIQVKDVNGKPLFMQQITSITPQTLQPGLFSAN